MNYLNVDCYSLFQYVESILKVFRVVAFLFGLYVSYGLAKKLTRKSNNKGKKIFLFIIFLFLFVILISFLSLFTNLMLDDTNAAIYDTSTDMFYIFFNIYYVVISMIVLGTSLYLYIRKIFSCSKNIKKAIIMLLIFCTTLLALDVGTYVFIYSKMPHEDLCLHL